MKSNCRHLYDRVILVGSGLDRGWVVVGLWLGWVGVGLGLGLGLELDWDWVFKKSNIGD